MVKGKRKTQDPCPNCGLHKSLCLCTLIPKLDLRTRVCLVVHHKELKRTTNTGKLAILALKNSEIRVRGLKNHAEDFTDLLQNKYRSLLFFPSEDAIELDQGFIASDPRPIQLFVPDGNWRQASKVHSRHKELATIPRVKISAPNPNRLHLRKETTEEGMATLQAIAVALGRIEGSDVGQSLMALYEEKLKRTLKARGVSSLF